MAATLYTGNGSTQTISNGANNTLGTTFQPDLVWIKSRSAATSHEWTDSVRGVTKSLSSNSTAAEATDTNGLTAFGSTGFTIGSDTNYNNNTATYVAWNWKAGGTAVTNTSGSITSQVSANPTAGFSIVTYTGTGANATVGHGLGVAPSMVIVKGRNVARTWAVYHANLVSAAYYIGLETTNPQLVDTTMFNSTAPTSSVFSVGTYNSASANTYVAYCFLEVAGYSKFGSYTGNGSSDGPFVYLGFRPRWILIRSTTASRDWLLYDTARAPFNVLTEGPLQPNNGLTAYSSSYLQLDILSNGFKPRDPITNLNASGETMIFAAFAENPFKNSLAR
jgi:hypothetical protein